MTRERQIQSHHEGHEAGNQEKQIYHRGHGGKNLSQRIYAGRTHKYTDSMYYLHFLHELHGKTGCSLWLKLFHFRVFSCFSW